MSESNPYRPPGAGETSVRHDGAAGPTGELRGCRRVVHVMFVLVSLFAILHLLSAIATLITVTLPPPRAIEGFGSVPGESREWQATFYRHALVRGFTVLATALALGVLAYLLRRYARWLLQAADRNIGVRELFPQFQLYAVFGLTASCVGCGGSLLLSAAAIPYNAAMIVGRLLVLAVIAGFVVSTIAVALGRSTNVRFAHAGSLYVFAWLGILLPLSSFAAGLYRISWLFIQMFANWWRI